MLYYVTHSAPGITHARGTSEFHLYNSHIRCSSITHKPWLYCSLYASHFIGSCCHVDFLSHLDLMCCSQKDPPREPAYFQVPLGEVRSANQYYCNHVPSISVGLLLLSCSTSSTSDGYELGFAWLCYCHHLCIIVLFHSWPALICWAS